MYDLIQIYYGQFYFILFGLSESECLTMVDAYTFAVQTADNMTTFFCETGA